MPYSNRTLSELKELLSAGQHLCLPGDLWPHSILLELAEAARDGDAVLTITGVTQCDALQAFEFSTFGEHVVFDPPLTQEVIAASGFQSI